jgi:hypothetical protein
MVYAAFALLGLYGVALTIAVVRNSRGKGGSDAAGRGLASAYLAAGVLIWIVLAGLTSLGAWTRLHFLMYAPLLPFALPAFLLIGKVAARTFRGLRSSMPTPELRRLEEAARRGNSVRAAELLSGGLRLDDPGIGRSLLESALDGDYARDVIPLLLKAGADPGPPELLAKALASTTTSLVPFLEHGADPNTLLPTGDPLLFAALEGGWTENVLALLKAGAALEGRDREGWTPLMAHATGRRGFGPGNWSGVADLLERGADPRAAAPDGTTLADLFARTPPFQIHPDRIEAIRRRLPG